ncbi:hypothetical protein F3K02_09240 [Hydrogenophaga sp. D2P1]|uniref:Uncharacterized protein n=1 Tax=Hydrogenophaga aromaticivorans TaxID=2610898 RepID=A0A7Y8GWG5_9BURK|nr:hypothetical protein [Hydrogenophaga aromaticivorans]NWF45429.1 hypothetical protein [Hydrogenophaga aromaticivorans]
MKDRWTFQDEHKLQVLLKRKTETTERNMKPLVLIARLLDTDSTDEKLAESLAQYADALRDALEPFDSGVRCAAEKGARDAN